MTSPVGDELREYYHSAPSDELALVTIELRHPGFDVPARLVNDPNDFIATLESDAPVDAGKTVTFTRCLFEATRPESTEQGMPTFTLAINNVSRQLMKYLEIAVGIAAPIELSVREYLVDDTSAPQQVIHGLTAKTASAGILRVESQCGFEDLLNKPYPFALRTSKDYPTLAR